MPLAGQRVMDLSCDGEVRCFHAGTPEHPVYVDQVRSSHVALRKMPVVMVHGAGHTGTCYLATPDRRPGWAPRFAAAGRDVFVPDWPGHGRSPSGPDFSRLGTRDVATSLLEAGADCSVVVPNRIPYPLGEVENFITVDDFIFEWLDAKLGAARRLDPVTYL
ncbi:alpha/beta fold hydrolase [Bradyrhizobium diazoefficiens]|nr:alpha/beta fold hydrolase [Bradyrhizobium diazoefficiens]APO50875.1 hypothetical protein BD122_11465 [Bradyrhizobium diazoefficiens]MCD9296849.1 alpha/beta fold hydrolase [Bradyrhizobium diazoefficiens]MCD9814428.1 alpha/beta fold hydrolase [Bradyrhizobium diazoefficiens]MCD9832660.1 alpha/beta fold hydrolase [Bradyrhizobium diazoefficiens]MCD9850920.1 alpha/beta fold hydrolase [Bradyrhizobium diazoefficiens]